MITTTEQRPLDGWLIYDCQHPTWELYEDLIDYRQHVRCARCRLHKVLR